MSRKVGRRVRKMYGLSIRYILFLSSFALSVFLPVELIAGWDDYTPRAINSFANPGVANAHANSGGRRIVRIQGTTIAICPHGTGERTYRSTNNGVTWEEIDTAGTYSGCLITGPGEMVYHFYRNADNVYMVKFKYNETPPPPVVIFTHPDLSETSTGVYRALNAIVGPNGELFVAVHWGVPDQLFLIRSEDGGSSWSGPYQISSGTGPWFYPHLEVTKDDVLVCVYAMFGGMMDIWFAKSYDKGATWTRSLISRNNTANPSLLTVGSNMCFVFAQSSEAAHKGLVYAYSDDLGNTWSTWQLIDPTCGYADPSPALGSDGKTIYVAYRSSNGTGITTGTCGDMSRSRLVMSPDLGKTWTPVDDYYEGERVGTRSQIRYQTWWNYGGPLEWIWMQYVAGGTSTPIFYDINTGVSIMSFPGPTRPTGPRIGKSSVGAIMLLILD